MKTLYKLKGDRPKPAYFLELTNEEAELAYRDGFYCDIELSNEVSCRYSEPISLTFEGWLAVHKVRIL